MSKTETQSEREMLEAAARAVGCAHLGVWDDGMGCLSNGEGWWFDPRKEGADAFELAAALRISVEHNDPCDNRPFVSAECCNRVGRVERFIEDVPEESQRADRMRLAILRCAAAQPSANGCERTESDANGCAEVQA